jgi:hypothetical protein
MTKVLPIAVLQKSMKERSRSKEGNKAKSAASVENGNSSEEQTERLVPLSHTNRPYFEVPSTSRRNGTASYHSEPVSYSRAGIGVVFRDADSSARALQELAQKRQERAERKRAGILLGMLLSVAGSVHFLTRPKAVPIPNQAKTKRSDSKIDYGGNRGSGGSGGGSRGRSDVDSMESESGNSNATRRESILDHFTDAMEDYETPFIPFFFHVPRSGGQAIKDIAGVCLSKVQACEVGVRNGHQTDTQLQIVTIENARYINVDTTTKDGIERAAMMGFGQAQMTDMVTSSYFLNAARFLFSEERPGRAFIIFRNPVHRAVSMYYFKRSVGDIDDKVSLEEFARGNGIENNWMTRFLTNAMEGELKKSHLDQAKKILSKKFLVGFLDDAEESVARVLKYLNWKFEEDETKALLQQDCIHRKLNEGSNRNPNDYELPKKGSQAYALLSWQTQFDLKLYGKFQNCATQFFFSRCFSLSITRICQTTF